MKIKATRAGFTMIELLVVVISLGVLSLASVNLFFTTTVGSTRENTTREIKQNGDFVISKMENDLRLARSVSSCQQDMNSISLVDVNSGQTNTWAVNGGGQITINNEAIISEDVRIPLGSNIDFDCTRDPGSNVTTVNVSFTLQKGNQNSDKAEEFAQLDFETTVTLRNR